MLGVFDEREILNALLAAQQANDAAFEAVAVTDDNTAAFRRGYRAALTTMALAFGLIPNETQEIQKNTNILLRADWRG